MTAQRFSPVTAAATAVACSLAPGAFKERIDLIGDLNREALRTWRRTGPRLELGYASEAEARIRLLVERERQCCGFLQFDVRLEGELMVLVITAPDDEMADAVLSPFENGIPEGVSNEGPATARTGKAVVTAAATSATAAVACGACCVLPLALPAVALGTFGGVLSWFADARIWMVAIAAVAVLGAWTWVWLESRRTSRRPARSTMAIMIAASAMLTLAVAWPAMEGAVVNAMKG